MADRDDSVYPGLAESGDHALELLPGGGVQVVFAAPGPAGSSVVEFPDGSAWEVDTARPWIPVAVRLPAGLLSGPDVVGAVAGSELVVGLFGAEGALFLADRIDTALGRGSGTAHESVRAHPVDRTSTIRGRDVLTSDPWFRTVDAGSVGALVVAADSAFDPSAPLLVRIAAAVAVLRSGRLDGAHGLLDPLGPGLVEVVERLAALVPDEEVELVDRDTRFRLAKSLGGVSVGSAGWSMAVASLRSRLTGDRGPGSWLDDAELATAAGPPVNAYAPAMMSADHLRRDVDVDALEAWEPEGPPGPVVVEVHGVPDGVRATVEQLDELLWRLVVAGPGPEFPSDEVQWLRVLRTEDLVAMAFVPLRTEAAMLVTEFVLPPGYRPGDLRFALDRRSPDPGDDLADLYRRAFGLGRTAARRARLDQAAPATLESWQRCAEAWLAAGDTARARLATGMAQRPARRPPLPRSTALADLVADDILDRE